MSESSWILLVMQAPFVGRHAESARLHAALASAANGSGRLVLISGPAGIGKSELTSQLVESASTVRTGQGYAVDDPGMPPLWPWHKVARDLPEIREALTAGTRFELFDAVAAELESLCATTGVLIVLEDLHWADSTSLALLRHIARELRRLPILVIATYRSPAGPALAEHLPDLLRSPHAQSISLSGLTAVEVRELLANSSTVPVDTAAELQVRTGGNPLYLRLLIESGADPAANPELRSLVTAQIDRLDADTRDALRAASVLGERFDPTMLPHMLNAEVSLDRATFEGIVRRIDVRSMAFSHALIRDAVYAELAPSISTVLHRRAAEALAEAAAVDTTLAGIVAGHWQRAAGPDAARHAARWALVAAQVAMTAAAYDEAAAVLESALETSPAEVDPAMVAQLTVELARAEFAAGRIADSLEHCIRAADIADRAALPELAAAAALVVHGVDSPHIVGTVDRLRSRALGMLPADAHALRARLLAHRARSAADAGNCISAREISAKALELAEKSQDSDAILDGIHARHFTLSAPQFVDERRILADRAVTVGARAEQPLAQLWGHIWNVDAGFQLGDIALVDNSLAEIEHVAQSRKLAVAWWHLHRLRAARAALVGELAIADEHAAKAQAVAEKIGDQSMISLLQAYISQKRALDGSIAPAELESYLAPLRKAPPIPIARIAVPMFYALAGDLDEARAGFEEFRHLPAVLEIGPRWAGVLHQIGVVAELVGDAEAAESVYQLFREIESPYLGDGTGAVFPGGSTAGVLGKLAFTAGHLDAAVEHFRLAVDVDGRIGSRPFVALSRVGLARALLARAAPGDIREARPLADQAAREFRRLGLSGRLREADSLAAELGRAARTPNPLTTREREVAELVADGMANRQIAAELVLSERTVETHVRSILAKLGLTNRTLIAAWALEQRQT
ncbi:helix-turn-helix transcriptional regulator [Nocardiaceae bacterium YC2-7]|uniref:Helix-turn-helix transcriptional regulator n=2 Tax=Antrihabitans stalactiti TaxID=2584121 RepID=A0A848KPJ1_9NOCA|nr:helix-turn-helix transcriptional regulator [Antrihabitans stalactiti]